MPSGQRLLHAPELRFIQQSDDMCAVRLVRLLPYGAEFMQQTHRLIPVIGHDELDAHLTPVQRPLHALEQFVHPAARAGADADGLAAHRKRRLRRVRLVINIDPRRIRRAELREHILHHARLHIRIRACAVDYMQDQRGAAHLLKRGMERPHKVVRQFVDKAHRVR